MLPHSFISTSTHLPALVHNSNQLQSQHVLSQVITTLEDNVQITAVRIACQVSMCVREGENKIQIDQ
jgi:hypothetical protein